MHVYWPSFPCNDLYSSVAICYLFDKLTSPWCTCTCSWVCLQCDPSVPQSLAKLYIMYMYKANWPPCSRVNPLHRSCYEYHDRRRLNCQPTANHGMMWGGGGGGGECTCRVNIMPKPPTPTSLALPLLGMYIQFNSMLSFTITSLLFCTFI